MTEDVVSLCWLLMMNEDNLDNDESTLALYV